MVCSREDTGFRDRAPQRLPLPPLLTNRLGCREVNRAPPTVRRLILQPGAGLAHGPPEWNEGNGGIRNPSSHEHGV